MSIWSTIAYKVKEIVKHMIGARTIEHTLNVSPVISSQMEEAIQLWGDMYKNEAPWLQEPSFSDPTRVVSLGLPSLIASEKARMALIEFQSEITAPTEEVEIDNPDYTEPEPDSFGNVLPSAQPPTIIEDRPIGDTARAEFLDREYQKLKKSLRRQLEYAIAKGGLIIKPYVVINDTQETGEEGLGQNSVIPTATIEFDFIQADCFYPLAFNAGGDITEAAFVQTKVEHDIIYRRLEYHKWTGKTVQIVNRAYKSTNTVNDGNMSGVDLGQEISLSEVPEWKDLQPSVTINNVDKPLFAYFKMPEANTIDPTSPLGVSGFSRAVSVIEDADRQYSRLLWEYEGGELAVDIDRDALREDMDKNGNTHTVRPMLQQRLFRTVDLGASSDTYYPYAPSLRDTSYIQGLNTILMRIEDICSISRGTLSDAAAEARTATELKILKQRSYQANKDIQDALEDTLRDVVYIMDVYCTLYNIVGDISVGGDGTMSAGNKGQWDISFEWDDSILTDVDEELNKRLNLMQNGLTSKLEVRMWYFGETERQARAALVQAQEEDRQAMEDNLMMESNIAAQNARRQ